MTDPLLAELRSAGAWDSRGVFTLRPDRATDLLRRCRLPAPELAVLKLVQAAVASGARRVAMAVDLFGVELRCDGAAPRQPELDDLLGHLFEGSAEPLRELALAVNDALARSHRVEVATPWGRRVWQGGGSWSEAGEPGGWPLQVRLGRPLPEVLRAAFPHGPPAREAEALRRGCGVSPAPVQVNGAVLEGEPWRPFAERYVVGDGVHAVAAPTASRARVPPRVPAHRLGRGRIPCRAVLALGPWERGEVRVVRHGVATSPAAGPPGLRALLAGDGLRFDLAGLQVVRDKAWEERLQWLAREAEQLSEDLSASLDRLPRAERAEALHWMDRLRLA